jgi:hypothetical protein
MSRTLLAGIDSASFSSSVLRSLMSAGVSLALPAIFLPYLGEPKTMICAILG